MINGYTSYKTVLAKIYRDLKLTTEVSEETVVEWIAETLDKIGTYNQYVEVKTCIDLIDGKAHLPAGFYKIVDIMFDNQPISWANNSMYNQYTCEGSKIPHCCTGYNFYINDSYIITDIPNTVYNTDGNQAISIIYLSVPVDTEGMPLVPDDVYFIKACVSYVTYMLDYQEWRKGNLPDKVLNKSETDYLWDINAARGSGNMPNAAKLDRLKNIWVRLMPLQNRRNLGEPERRFHK